MQGTSLFTKYITHRRKFIALFSFFPRKHKHYSVISIPFWITLFAFHDTNFSIYEKTFFSVHNKRQWNDIENLYSAWMHGLVVFFLLGVVVGVVFGWWNCEGKERKVIQFSHFPWRHLEFHLRLVWISILCHISAFCLSFTLLKLPFSTSFTYLLLSTKAISWNFYPLRRKLFFSKPGRWLTFLIWNIKH